MTQVFSSFYPGEVLTTELEGCWMPDIACKPTEINAFGLGWCGVSWKYKTTRAFCTVFFFCFCFLASYDVVLAFGLQHTLDGNTTAKWQNKQRNNSPTLPFSSKQGWWRGYAEKMEDILMKKNGEKTENILMKKGEKNGKHFNEKKRRKNRKHLNEKTEKKRKTF